MIILRLVQAHFYTTCFFFCFLIGLVGCTRLETTPEQTFCPSVTLIGDLSRNTLSTPNGPVSIAITHGSLQCSPDSSSSFILSLRVLAKKNSMLPLEEDVPFHFFVAIIRPNGEILAKEIFEGKLTFEKNQTKTHQRCLKTLSLPSSLLTPSQHNMVISGLHLDPHQVKSGESFHKLSLKGSPLRKQ